MQHQASYCTCFPKQQSCQRKKKVSTSAGKIWFRGAWNTSSLISKAATESCSSQKPPQLHSADSEMLNFLSSSLSNVVRKGLQRMLPVQEYITRNILKSVLINNHLPPELRMLRYAVQGKGQPLRSEIRGMEAISLGTMQR